MKKKRSMARIITGMMAAFLFGLCGCAARQEEPDDHLAIGVVYYEKSDTFMASLVEEIRNKFSEYEEKNGKTIRVVIRSSESSQKLQNTQIEELIDMGCQLLCVNLVDRADPSFVIDAAKEKNIPIIFFNREPVEDDMKRWDKLYYVGADPEQSGRFQGETVLSYLENHTIDKNHDGIIQYVVLEGEMGHQDAIIRTESVVDTMVKGGLSLEKLSYQIANWNRAQAQNRMEQLMGQYKNQIELVLANNDDMALGAMDAYRRLNYTEDSWPVFFGVDGTQAGLEAVRDGRLAGTVYNDKNGQASMISDLAVKLLLRESLSGIPFDKERTIYVPYLKVTAENLGQFIQK